MIICRVIRSTIFNSANVHAATLSITFGPFDVELVAYLLSINRMCHQLELGAGQKRYLVLARALAFAFLALALSSLELSAL